MIHKDIVHCPSGRCLLLSSTGGEGVWLLCWKVSVSKADCICGCRQTVCNDSLYSDTVFTSGTGGCSGLLGSYR